MTTDQDREAFEKAVTVEGMHVNLTRIGPADSRAGEYAHTIVQTCWQVWQYALAYSQEKQDAPEPEPPARYQQIESILRKNTQLAEVQVNAIMTLIIALDNCD
jgi:hypothetical protein